MGNILILLGIWLIFLALSFLPRDAENRWTLRIVPSIILLLISWFMSDALSDNLGYTTEKNNFDERIYSLDLNNDVHSEFTLGLDEVRNNYYFYIDAGDGSKIQEQVSASTTRIIEDSTHTPTLRRVKDVNASANWWWVGPWLVGNPNLHVGEVNSHTDIDCYLIVPEGTIIR